MRRFIFFPFILFSLCALAQKTQTKGGIFLKAQELMKDAQKELVKARKVLKDIEGSDPYKKLITDKQEVTLPIKIPLKNTSSKYQIGLSDLTIQKEYATAGVYMKLDPKIFSPTYDGDTLFFSGRDIRFTKKGGFTGDLEMILLDSVNIPMGAHTRLTLFPISPHDQSVTYATFDCDGFKELHIAGGITFSKDILRLEGDSGKTKEEDATFYFETTIQDWDDWIIELNEIPTFQLTKLAGFSWSVDAFVLDKSITRNSSDFVVPNAYDISYLNGMEEMWNGVFFKNITVKMPRDFKEKGQKTTERMTIMGSYFLIDQKGITGNLLGTDIIKNGDIGRWTYTLDTVRAEFAQNALVGAGFSGTLDMPLSKDSTDGKFGLAYKGLIDRDAKNNPVYTFNIKNLKGISFKMWAAAKVDSLIVDLTVRSSNGNFYGNVKLSGNLIISPSFKKEDGNAETKKSATAMMVKVEALEFKSTPSYYVGVKSVALHTSGKSLLSKLPVSINEIKLIDNKGSLGVQFNLVVNLMKSDGKDAKTSNGFGASGLMTIYAKENPESGKWGYDRTQLDRLCITVKNGGFSFDGCIMRFSGDTAYGEGFQGNLKAEFPCNIKVELSGMFGRVEEKSVDLEDPSALMDTYNKSNQGSASEGSFRYWFVDGSVDWGVAIPIYPSIGMQRFMGGAYHNMTLHPVLNGFSAKCVAGTIGCSSGGAKFTPNSRIALGIRAGIGIVSTGSKFVFDGNLLFGIEFLKTGGIEKIYFDGLANFVNFASTIKADKITKMANTLGNAGERPEKCVTQGLSVGWHTEYNFTEQTFSGTFDIKINVLEVIQGSGQECTAGKIELYFSPKDWYLYVGRPNARNGINVIGVLKVESYLIAGSVLPQPAIAPLPDGISGGGIDPTLLPSGGGIGFGVRLGAKVHIEGSGGGESCKIGGGVDAGFEIGLDLLIAKDKKGIDCGQGIRGINQWYATGQVYLLVWGSVFVNYDCSVLGISKSGSLTLCELRASASLFGQLPKPTWFEGQLEARGSVLGFGVSTSMKFKYGDPCTQAVKMGDRDFDIVQMVIPYDTLALSSVYTSPGAVLKYAVGTQFSMNTSGNSGKEMQMVTIQEPQFKVTAYSLRTKQTSTVQGQVKLDVSKTNISYSPLGTLPDSAIINVEMTITYLASGGDRSTSVKTWKFQTVSEPMKIENTNIQYAYPLPQMTNMYPSISSNGYIRFRTVPSRPLDPNGYSFQVRYLENKEVVYQNSATVKTATGNDHIEFVIPKDILKVKTNYTLQIVKVPSLVQQDKRTGSVSEGFAGGDKGNQEIIIVEYPFTTSLFRTFEEKMAAYGEGAVGFESAGEGIVTLGLNTTTTSGAQLKSEGFSFAELKGYSPIPSEQLPPSILIESQPIAAYENALANENVKQNKGFMGAGNDLPKKFPPYDAIQIVESELGFNISYEVPKYLKQGLWYEKNVNNKDVTEKVLKNINSNGNVLLNGGVYVLTAKYYLPGKTSSAAQVNINLKIPDSKPILFQ